MNITWQHGSSTLPINTTINVKIGAFFETQCVTSLLCVIYMS